MSINNSQNNSKDEAGHKASPFVVDLREQLARQELLKTQQRPQKVDFAGLFKFKIPKLNFSFLNYTKRFSLGVFSLVIDVAKTFAMPFTAAGRLSKILFRKIASFKIVRPKFLSRSKSPVEKIQNIKQEILEDVELLGEFLEDERSKFALRPWFGFVAILFLLILPFKGFGYFKSLDDLKNKIISNSGEAIIQLKAASQSAGKMDFKSASKDFTQAQTSFISAKNELDGINSFFFEVAKIMPSSDLRLAGSSQHILAAGALASRIGANMSLAIDGLVNGRQQGLLNGLNAFEQYGAAAQHESESLKGEISQINAEDLPVQYQEQFKSLQEKADFLSGSLKEVLNIVHEFKILVGAERDTRYLLVFQNNAEMRASGGFFGSYALIDFSQGKVKKIETPAGGTYDVEAAYKQRIIAPTPLWLVNPLWHLWDANWWYDWPTTAQKLEWFYAKSGGPTVDGVISLTPTVIEDLLRAVGPVDMQKDYGVTISADNFWQVTEQFAEQKQNVTKKPKRIVGDLLNRLMEELPKRLDKKLLYSVVSSAEQSLNQKQILFYFKNQELEDAVSAYGWDGRVKNSDFDYLAVINSNIAGAKSDREIKQSINHKATVMSDGSVIDEVEIVRQHAGMKGATFTGVRNVDWLRVYVPQGSELIEATGFTTPDAKYFGKPEPTWQHDEDLNAEDVNFQLDQPSGTKIYQEFGKTVFANWIMVDPGHEARIYLKYKLPARLTKEISTDLPGNLGDILDIGKTTVLPYALMVQKQPGALATNFSSVLNIQPLARLQPMSLAWQSFKVGGQIANENGWQITSDLLEDQYWATLYQQK